MTIRPPATPHVGGPTWVPCRRIVAVDRIEQGNWVIPVVGVAESKIRIGERIMATKQTQKDCYFHSRNSGSIWLWNHKPLKLDP